MRVKLTPAFAAKAKADPGAERTIYWDPTLAGFGLVVTASGARSFVVQYRAGRRSRRMAIKGVLTLDQARKKRRSISAMLLREAIRSPSVARKRRAEKTPSEASRKNISSVRARGCARWTSAAGHSRS
jgi:hypothetical protein